jgi:histidinol phosphatase-like PHP family hydrolase
MFNYHTHISFCDGRQDAEEIVHKAILKFHLFKFETA